MQASSPPPVEQKDALVRVLESLLNVWENDHRAIVLGVLALLVLALTAIDGMFKHFRTVRLLWKGALAVGRYLRDLFMGPIKVRALEAARQTSERAIEPIYHLNMVWFPSETELGMNDPFCQYCWADKRKIAITWNAHDGRVYCYCRYNRTHGSDTYASVHNPSQAEFDHARSHVHDLRARAGL